MTENVQPTYVSITPQVHNSDVTYVAPDGAPSSYASVLQLLNEVTRRHCNVTNSYFKMTSGHEHGIGGTSTRRVNSMAEILEIMQHRTSEIKRLEQEMVDYVSGLHDASRFNEIVDLAKTVGVRLTAA